MQHAENGGPFDDSARARQTRMGIPDAEGRTDRNAAAVMARVCAELLFDDRCEPSPDTEQVCAISAGSRLRGAPAERDRTT